jgi:hypothetical protein
MGIAGGTMHVKGYFDGSDPNKIYFNPIIKTSKVQLDQLLFKFDNFGQDYVLSNNLHGQLTSTITGKIRTHADLVPILEESDISIAATVYNGRLENYAPFEALSPYFPDKNWKQVRFDTLSNTLQVKNGKLIIPLMTINSTLGYLQMDGEQEMVGQGLMNYHFRIPMSLVTEVSKNALFGKKNNTNATEDDEIQYMEDDKNTRFLHLQMTGTSDKLEVKPLRKKR